MDDIQGQISRLSFSDYKRSLYQASVLANLEELNIIPDWYNLFVISLLHAHEKIIAKESVAFYSIWSEEDILRVIRESPEFTEFYLREIKDKISFKEIKYLPDDLERSVDHTIAIGRRSHVNEANCYFDLVSEIGDYAKVDRSYHTEQVHPVWVRNKSASYPVSTTPFRVGSCLSSDDVWQNTLFTVDGAFANAYATYSTLSRRGGSETKCMVTYFTYPNDYGPNGVADGSYCLPIKLYHLLPEWIKLVRNFSVNLQQGLNWVETLLLLNNLDLEEGERVREWALTLCDKFTLEVGWSKQLQFVTNGCVREGWLYSDPRASVEEVIRLETDLLRVSPEEERRLDQAKQKEEIRKKLQYTIKNPRKKNGYSLAELKQMTVDYGVKLGNAKKKADIAQIIHDAI